MSLQASPQANVASFLVQAARRWPALPALASGAATICDYAELASRAARLAGAFGALGLQQGERVLIISRNVPSYIEALFGCWWAGLVAVPVNAKLHAKELAFVVDNCRPRVALVDAAWQSAIGELRPQRPALVVAELGGAEYARLLTGSPRPCA